MKEAYIYDGIRTPFGRYGGALATIRPDDMIAKVIKDLMARNKFDPNDVEDVIVGCATQAGEDGRNIARFAGLMSGIPVKAGGITVNRLCGSGMASILDAARCIRCNEGELFVAGGVESMSRAPLVISKASSPYGRDVQMFDTTLGMRFPNSNYVDNFGDESLIQTADNIAKEVGVSREDSDEFAYNSQQKYAKCLADGFFDDEITPVEIYDRKEKSNIKIDRDEHPRPDGTLEKLGTLRVLSPGGVVTAGNASGINDGAGAVIVGSKEIGEKAGIKPKVKVVGGAIAGVEPRIMGMGPVTATQKVLDRAGLSIDQMDVMEFNEAFATQVLGCMKELGLKKDDPRVNIGGGAVAVGHPLGASGNRITLTAMRQLEKCGGRYALATMCVGVGQGIAVILEKV